MTAALRLSILPDTLAVARLAPEAALPDWIRGAFVTISRTADELSIVCDDDAVPQDIQAERGWAVFKLHGPIPFQMIGIAAALVNPLAEAKISVFLISTFDTDYLLVKRERLTKAADVLRRAGHDVS
jgi:uncharacterized protein